MASDSYAFHTCRMPTAYRYIDAKTWTCPWLGSPIGARIADVDAATPLILKFYGYRCYIRPTVFEKTRVEITGRPKRGSPMQGDVQMRPCHDLLLEACSIRQGSIGDQ